MDYREGSPYKPIKVEVIAFAPTAFYHCQHCEVVFQEVGVGPNIHREQVIHALPDDLAHDYQNVSDWARTLAEHYGSLVIVKVIDAASVEGFWKSLRYGVRRYPAVIVAGKDKHLGIDLGTTYRLIDRYLAPTSVH